MRLYDRLFVVPEPEDVEEGKDFRINLNPQSLQVTKAWVEPFIGSAKPGHNFQFERNGYYVADSDSKANNLVFNRTVALKDTWARMEKTTELA